MIIPSQLSHWIRNLYGELSDIDYAHIDKQQLI
jgi:hypothetical protein